jgi:hypothetical protein
VRPRRQRRLPHDGPDLAQVGGPVRHDRDRAGHHAGQVAAHRAERFGEIGEHLAGLGGEITSADELAPGVQRYGAGREDDPLAGIDHRQVGVVRRREQPGNDHRVRQVRLSS